MKLSVPGGYTHHICYSSLLYIRRRVIDHLLQSLEYCYNYQVCLVDWSDVTFVRLRPTSIGTELKISKSMCFVIRSIGLFAYCILPLACIRIISVLLQTLFVRRISVPSTLECNFQSSLLKKKVWLKPFNYFLTVSKAVTSNQSYLSFLFLFIVLLSLNIKLVFRTFSGHNF